PLMVAMSAVGYTGGSITTIMLNIPGDANAATVIDGFPMTQKGEGGRAVGAALASSGLGGLATVFIALAMVPLVLPLVMAVRAADMVFIILLGITFISVLGRGSMVKGLLSGMLGLLVSLIGYQIITAVPRFTFGMVYLYDGIALIPVTMGLFALPEAVALAAKGGTIAQAGTAIKGMKEVLEGVRDVFRHWGLWLRSTIIGYIAGVIPGVGAMTAMFIAYGQAKATSKHPELFGTGIIEGVIAPESANNAKESGALLTTLALGIPGSAAMAILLGAFLMVGLIPGPEMMTMHLDLSLSLLMVIIIANAVAAVICLFAAPYVAKIAFVPGRFVVPLVVVLVLTGTFMFRQDFADVGMTLIWSVLGLAMRQFGYNRPALFLGFILGILFEKYLFLASGLGGPLFFMRPISLTLIVIIIAVIIYGPISSLFKRNKRGAKKA
ncbi:tripartite tricarboxylate transporter permease, partial [Chloroflexota bacterium]